MFKQLADCIIVECAIGDSKGLLHVNVNVNASRILPETRNEASLTANPAPGPHVECYSSTFCSKPSASKQANK